jgi:hypothetical protein
LACNGCRWSDGGGHGGQGPAFGRLILGGDALLPLAPPGNFDKRIELAALDLRTACDERRQPLWLHLLPLPQPQQPAGA